MEGRVIGQDVSSGCFSSLPFMETHTAMATPVVMAPEVYAKVREEWREAGL